MQSFHSAQSLADNNYPKKIGQFIRKFEHPSKPKTIQLSHAASSNSLYHRKNQKVPFFKDSFLHIHYYCSGELYYSKDNN